MNFDERHEQDTNGRKPEKQYYNTGRWSVYEHELFLKGLRKHGRNWKLIQGIIQSRSATQVRTHAQKFFTRDNYQATKRGRYASRLKDIETPDIMEWLRASGALNPQPTAKSVKINSTTTELSNNNNNEDETSSIKQEMTTSSKEHHVQRFPARCDHWQQC